MPTDYYKRPRHLFYAVAFLLIVVVILTSPPQTWLALILAGCIAGIGRLAFHPENRPAPRSAPKKAR